MIHEHVFPVPTPARRTPEVLGPGRSGAGEKKDRELPRIAGGICYITGSAGPRVLDGGEATLTYSVDAENNPRLDTQVDLIEVALHE